VESGGGVARHLKRGRTVLSPVLSSGPQKMLICSMLLVQPGELRTAC